MTDPYPPLPEEEKEPRAAPPGGGFEIPWRTVAALLLVALIVVFAVENTQDVELHFLAWSWQLPLVIVVLIAVVASILLDQVLTGIFRRRRLRRAHEREELRRLRGED